MKVLVTFTAVATYSKIVEMTAKEFEFYVDALDRAKEDRELRAYHEELFEEFGFTLAEPMSWEDPELEDFHEDQS
jgi:hypothetical protein